MKQRLSAQLREPEAFFLQTLTFQYLATTGPSQPNRKKKQLVNL